MAEPVGDAADEEAPEQAPQAEEADERDALRFAQPRIERVGHEVHHRYEKAHADEQRHAVHEPEGRTAQRFGEAHSRERRAVHAAAHGLAPAERERRRHREQEHGRGEREIGVAPAHEADQPGGGERHDEVAGADARHGDARSERAVLHERLLHGGDRRHVGKSDAEPGADAVGQVEQPDRRRVGGERQAGSEAQRAGEAYAARPEAVGEHAARHPGGKPEQRAQ